MCTVRPRQFLVCSEHENQPDDLCQNEAVCFVWEAIPFGVAATTVVSRRPHCKKLTAGVSVHGNGVKLRRAHEAAGCMG